MVIKQETKIIFVATVTQQRQNKPVGKIRKFTKMET